VVVGGVVVVVVVVKVLQWNAVFAGSYAKMVHVEVKCCVVLRWLLLFVVGVGECRAKK
jgi:hypothetical protein